MDIEAQLVNMSDYINSEKKLPSPKIEPCGTPNNNGAKRFTGLSTNQVQYHKPMVSEIMWSTVSKAADKTSKIRATVYFRNL